MMAFRNIMVFLFLEGIMAFQGAAEARPLSSLQNVTSPPSLQKEKTLSSLSPHHWEISFGVPGLLEGRLKSKIGEQNYIGIGYSYVPVSKFLPMSQQRMVQKYSDRFDTIVVPGVDLQASSVFLQHRFSNGWFIEPQVNFLVLRGGGEAYLSDPTTQVGVKAADISFSFYQVMGTLAGGYAWAARPEDATFEIGGGLSYSFFHAVQLQIKGGLPAFLALAPEYQTSFVTDTAALERDFMRTLDESGLLLKILPTFFIRWSW